MEDYKKKLKDALYSEVVPDGVQEWIEENFPELAETDDDRIRKYIISSLNSLLYTKGSQADIERNYAIAWLEKQCEQKQDPCEHCENIILNCHNFPCIKKKAFKQGKSVFDIVNEEKVDNANKIEQKTADKSNSILNILNKENLEVQQEELIKKPSLINKENEMVLSDVISILDNGFMPSSMERARLVKGLQSIKSQPDHAWSEEDEKMRKRAICACNFTIERTMSEDHYGEARDWLKSLPVGFITNSNYNQDMVKLLVSELLQIANNNNAPRQYDSEIAWLKSLRPQNCWKPSDEQIDALEIAIKAGIQLGTWEEEALRELKEQLKKLKE